jgi:DNA-binding IclR family transcriptional regulator
MEAYRCGTGKMLLSSLDEETLSRLLSQYEFKRYTRKTITTADALRKELEKIRACGYAEDREESEIGLSCMAAPIYDTQGEMIAAVSISGGTSSMNVRKEEKLALLQESALHISNALGY